MNTFVPLIVGLGGTTRTGSSSELALRFALKAAERAGAKTAIFAGPALEFPMYAQDKSERSPQATELICMLRQSHGIIVSSPGYHGSISGLIKNALDYVEDMRGDGAAYFDGRAVGCVASAYGWQATGSTLAALRSIVHALRGWPTPVGVAINSSSKIFDVDGACLDTGVEKQLELMARQVVDFARMRALGVDAAPLARSAA
ncbi:MAG: NADPH-dependent reductase [Nevskia sp.]|nr:NADPH-dependent reductase [Nevskia sp.]